MEKGGDGRVLKDIDLRLLEIFRFVYEKRSLTEASKELYISQSTLSFHISNLEKQVGHKLFYRKGKYLVPSTFADRLYEYARELAGFKRRLLKDIGRFSGKDGGFVRIGASSIPGNYILPELLGEFLENLSGNLNLEVEIGDSASVYEGVVSGRLDFGVVGYLPNKKELDFKKFFEDTILLVGNPQIEERTYSLEELRDLPLVIREEGSGTRSTVEESLRQHGLSLRDMNVIATLGGNSAIISFLRKVRAVSFLSSYALKGDKSLVKLKVRNLGPIMRSFYLIRDPSRPMSKAGEKLFEFLLIRTQKIV